MGGMNFQGLNIPNMYQPQNSPVAPSYGGQGQYNQMAWGSSPLSRQNPYSNPNMQPRGAWYGGGFGGGYGQSQGYGQGFGQGYGGSGGFNGGPLTPTPQPPSLPTSGSWGAHKRAQPGYRGYA